MLLTSGATCLQNPASQIFSTSDNTAQLPKHLGSLDQSQIEMECRLHGLWYLANLGIQVEYQKSRSLSSEKRRYRFTFKELD